jgi:hypothetical protein
MTWVRFAAGPRDFSCSIASRPALRHTQPGIQWVPGVLSSGVKRQGREAAYSHPSSAGVKSGGAIPPLHHTSSWRSAQLIKHRDNFTFFFTYMCVDVGLQVKGKRWNCV